MNAIEKMMNAIEKAGKHRGPRDLRIRRHAPIRPVRLGDWASGDGNPFYDESFAWPDVYAAVRSPALLGCPDGATPLPRFNVWDNPLAQGEKIDQTFTIDPIEMGPKDVPPPIDYSQVQLSKLEARSVKTIFTPTNMLIILAGTSVGFFVSNRQQLRNAALGAALGFGTIYAIRAFQ